MATSSIHCLSDMQKFASTAARKPAAATEEGSMRRESFETPGPLELNVRVPSGRIDIETVEGTETVVEIECQPRDRGGGAHRASVRSATGTR